MTLQRIIQELRDRLIDAAEACRRMTALRAELRHEGAIAAEHGLTPVSFAVYGLLAEGVDSDGTGSSDGARRIAEPEGFYAATFDEGLKDTARQIDAVLQDHRAIVDWHLNHDVQREMRRDIKRILRGTRPEDEEALDELARWVIEVARTRLS